MSERPPKVSSSDYAHAFPDRLAVHRFYRQWRVWQGWTTLDTFPTHAEAITFAQEQATIQALAARFTIPPNPIAAALQEVTP